MNKDHSFPDDQLIDVTPSRKRKWPLAAILSLLVLLFVASRSLSIYVSALWFGSLGYASVYWYIFRSKLILFFLFAILTLLILRAALWLVQRAFTAHIPRRRTIVVNDQPVTFSPARFLGPAAWVISLVGALISGLSMKGAWQSFALYLASVSGPSLDQDPIP
jgi:uncharacterized membrane protein (UPF0182 family)